MGEQWDYKTRKVEIAWELAKQAIKRRLGKSSGMNDETYRDMVKKELQAAWDAVNSVFPNHND